MARLASDIARDILYQKLSYAYKTLSYGAVESNMYTFYGMFDYISFSFDITITDTVFSSLISSVLFGIPLSDVIPASLDFEVLLPTPEEFAKGTHIKIEMVSILERYPELLTLSSMFYGVFKPDVATTLLSQQLEKGVYGRSRYGYAYYDPPAVREFLRSTLFALTKKRSTDESVRARVESAARALNINMDVTSYVFNSLQMLYYAKYTACSFDYCWFDVSVLPAEGSEAKIRFVGWDLQPVEADYISIADASGSCWFDNCLMDFNVFAPDEPPTIYVPERAGNLLSEMSQYLVNRARSRILVTPLALSNYQTHEEMDNPAKSARTDHFGVGRYILESARDLVKSVIGEEVPSPYMLNLYADAVAELLRALTRPGGWGDEAFRAMSRDELLEYFKERWGSQGLDRKILEKLFSYVYDTGIAKVLSASRRREREVVKASRGGK